MMSHKKKLKPSERLLGNAVIAHALHSKCPGGRMVMVEWWSDSNTHKYGAKFVCKICGGIVESQHNKPGGS
jgi:hypothetical protein